MLGFEDYIYYKFLGYFVWKNHDFMQKIIFFPILGGGGVCSPGSAPDIVLSLILILYILSVCM